mgnify:FL=1
MRFSERYGYQPVREVIQKESMDNELRNGIWSTLNTYIWNSDLKSIYTTRSTIYSLLHAYWFNLLKEPTDFIPSRTSEALKAVRLFFFKLEWHEVYSIIEETHIHFPLSLEYNKNNFFKSINNILERENSAYRLIGNEITPITSEQEIQSIEDALANPYSGVQQHLNQALKLMSDRQKPDYRNSIKESISAVESICKIVTQDEKSTLGKALKIIEDKFGLHPALKGSLSQLYGYTSDSDGIRHAMIEESNLSYIDAKFMLVACTNFINYLIEKTQ